jgi:hypothetical protein
VHRGAIERSLLRSDENSAKPQVSGIPGVFTDSHEVRMRENVTRTRLVKLPAESSSESSSRFTRRNEYRILPVDRTSELDHWPVWPGILMKPGWPQFPPD